MYIKSKNNYVDLVAQRRESDPEPIPDYYQPQEPYYEPLQPVVANKPVDHNSEKWQKKLQQEIKARPNPMVDEYLRDSNAGILSAAFIIFFLIVLMCCCIFPVCYYLYNPKAKNFVSRIATSAREKMKALINLRNIEYQGLSNSDEEERERPRRRKPKTRPKRTQQDNKKCKTTIAIPIFSDTSVDICVVTEEEDECDSTDSEQNGYISKEMDALRHNYSDEEESPLERMREKKGCPFDKNVRNNYGDSQPPPQRYGKDRHHKGLHNMIVDTTDIEDRYKDAHLQQKTKSKRRGAGYRPNTRRNPRNLDIKEDSHFKTPSPIPSPPEENEDIYLPPEFKNYLDDEEKGKKQEKDGYYDELIKEWKYRQKNPTNDLGSPPPPRKANKNKTMSKHKGSLPF